MTDAPKCQTCQKPIKFELLKDDQGQAIPKPGEFTKDGKQKYRYKPVNIDGSKHECAAAVFTAKPAPVAAPAPIRAPVVEVPVTCVRDRPGNAPGTAAGATRDTLYDECLIMLDNIASNVLTIKAKLAEMSKRPSSDEPAHEDDYERAFHPRR